MPIRDRWALTLAYTPGVGASCKAIEKDQELAYTYTNKLNTIMVMTDSSGFPDFDETNWNNYVPIPYLECQSVYYKAQTNVDCYPLVLDYTRVKTEDDILDVIVHICPAFHGFELYKVSIDKCRRFAAKY